MFSWKSPSDQNPPGPDTRDPEVSILVFVEVALGRASQSMSRSPSTCFNPCFRGSRPRTDGKSRFCRERPRVSILVFVEVALGLNSPAGSAPRSVVSILVFVEVALGQYPDWKAVEEIRGFNPCFRGSRPRTEMLDYSIEPARWFQSLFSWKSPSDVNLVLLR